MSINETEFVDIGNKFLNNDLNVKAENYYEDGENRGHEFPASESKCGEIFHSANGLFVFCCYYCSERFAAIEGFVSHFEEKHANTLITTKTDETPLNLHLREPEDTNEYLGSQTSEILPWITDNPIKIEENLDSENYVSTDLFNEDETNVEKIPKVYSETVIQCPKCPYTFRWKNDLVYHLCQIHKDYSGNEMGDAKSEKKVHTVQGNGEMSFECSHCSKAFCRKRSLQRHLRCIHNVVTNPKTRKSISLTCRFCDMTFRTIEEAETHEGLHTFGDRFQCHTCSKTFKLKRRLELHKLVHTGGMPFKCLECRKEFPYKSGLTAHHKRVHLKEKNFSCDHCEKRFASNTDRKSHMRIHFNEKPYQCEECGKNFTTTGGLSFHKLHHTQTKRHTCEICQKSFYTTVDLRNHMPVHTKEKLFQCTVCQSKFTTQKHLRGHIKLHTGEKNYVCTICKKAFAQRSGLYFHMKSHDVVGNRKETVSND